ncbi:MAG TPA: ion transporter [Steroidobacteraceae bacterium]|nr:ion transporter [Steroidobacteraceae bacterium]
METEVRARPGDLRTRLALFVEQPRIQNAIVAVILINAVTLGLETAPRVVAAFGPGLEAIDHLILGIFVVELAVKLFAYGPRFFRSAWNVFDLVIVGISLLPSSGPFTVLRALRVLRLFRLLSAVPRMRIVIESLVQAIPGLGSIALLLLLFFYVFAVMATRLFGEAFPHYFGSLATSLFSLFQIMTLENWPDIAREVMTQYPHAWLFFLVFILLATFTVLNLFIALIVNAMQNAHAATEVAEAPRLTGELASLHEEIRALRAELSAHKDRDPPR